MASPRKPHIVLVVARGEAVRNFLYSDTLPALSEKARVTLLSRVDHGEVIQRAQPYVDRVIPLAEYPEVRLVVAHRNTLHYAHLRWLWSEAAKYYWGQNQARTRSLPGRLRWAWNRSMAGLLAHPPILEWMTRLDEFLSWKLRPTRQLDQIFTELQPDLVFNCSHIHGPHADLPMRIAYRLGFPTAAFIFSWDNLTSRSRIFVPYDYYLMWNEEMKALLLAQYPFLDARQVLVTGTPQFDFHFKPEFLLTRQELCARLGLDASRPFILYSTGMDTDFPHEHKFVEAVIHYLKNAPLQPRPQLVVRTYIKGTSPEMQALAERREPDVVFPPILWDKQWIMPLHEDLSIYTSLLHHASLGINAASTVSLELMMLDKPVINIGMEPPGSSLPHYTRFSRHVEYEHYRPVVLSGGVMVARSMEELRRMLQQGLQHPQEGREARRRFIRQMFGDRLDGRSGWRVAESLIELATNGAG